MKIAKQKVHYLLAFAIVLFALLRPVTMLGVSSAAPQGGQRTITQPISVGPDERAVVRFEVFTPGVIRARVTWQGDAQRLALILNGPRRPELPNPVGFYARGDGPSPLEIEYTVTAEDVRRGVSWRVSVVNFETGTARGTLTVSFPEQIPAGTPTPIRLQTISLLPSAAATEAFKAALQQTTAPALHGIVQFARLPTAAQRRALESRGIKLLTYLSNKAYFASVSKQATLDNIPDAPAITFATLLNPEDKIQPDLNDGNFAKFIVRLDDGRIVNYVLNADGSVNVTVVFYADTRREEKEALLRNHALSFRKLSETHFVAVMQQDQLVPLASNDIVKWIDAGPAPGLPDNDRTRQAVGVEQLQGFNAMTCGYNLDGNGIQVGIYDTGVDETHNDFFALNGCAITTTSRVIADIGGTTTPAGNHGTHVAGIVAGNGFQSNVPPNGGMAFQWRGMAPLAQLIDGDIGGGGDIVNMGRLHQAIVTLGMDVSNHSYSFDFDGNYSTFAETRDQSIRGDSVFVDAMGNPQAIPARLQVYSAGNHGTFPNNGGEQVGFFALTKGVKNAVIVGNWNVINPNNPVQVPTGGQLAMTSSLGPTYDGRIKPDVVAPGSNITSTSAGLLTSCAGGIANGYVGCGGTSMAAPATTGIVALMLQAFATQPLPSTLRAVLVHTATDIVANDVGGFNSPDTGAPIAAFVGPDFATGYGLANADAAIELIQDSPQNIIEDEISGTCDQKTYTVNVVAGLPQLKVTLAWDDAEGDPNSAVTDTKLVNDLDLVLVDPNGNKYYPWLLNQTPSIPNDMQQCGDTVTVTRALIPANNPNFVSPGNPANVNDPITAADFTAAGNGRDHLNNLEQIVINAPVAGVWTVMVEGFGVPLGPQQFSLVWGDPLEADLAINKTVAPDPVMTGANVTYTITVTNNGPDTAPSATVMDILPASVTFDSCAVVGGVGGTCGGVGNNRTVTFTSLAANSSATITLVARANCSLPNNTVISNTATVSSPVTDPNPTNNLRTVMVTASNPPPVITCPANRNVVAAEPGDMSVIVSYPAPTVTDNCPGAAVVCVPPSGASFPLGTTTVTCTATDSGGATASCSFTVTAWDVLIQDDDRRDFLLFNSFTGDYLFTKCGPDSFTMAGRGRITRVGCSTKLEDDTRVVYAEVIRCTLGTGNTGRARINRTPLSPTFILKDSYIFNNTPMCP